MSEREFWATIVAAVVVMAGIFGALGYFDNAPERPDPCRCTCTTAPEGGA
jgi:hypothetical protein